MACITSAGSDNKELWFGPLCRSATSSRAQGYSIIKKMEGQEGVIIVFNYGLEENEPFYELSEKLRVLVDESGLGYYDGHEMNIDNSDGSFYLYGPDAK